VRLRRSMMPRSVSVCKTYILVHMVAVLVVHVTWVERRVAVESRRARGGRGGGGGGRGCALVQAPISRRTQQSGPEHHLTTPNLQLGYSQRTVHLLCQSCVSSRPLHPPTGCRICTNPVRSPTAELVIQVGADALLDSATNLHWSMYIFIPSIIHFPHLSSHYI
jgi:hypothetical protein